MSLLVDSSVWIAAARPGSRECMLLRRLILDGEQISFLRLIQVEVCQGARSERQFDALWDAFLGFELIPTVDEDWMLSARNYLHCRKKGLALSTIDCYIATIAARARCTLWSLDGIFPRIQPVLGLDLYEPDGA